MNHLWSARPRIYYGFFGLFFGAILLAWDPMHWPTLHHLWMLRILAGIAIGSAFAMMHFKSGTPTCFALEAYSLRQEKSRTIPNTPLISRHERSANRVPDWSMVKASGMGALISGAVQTVILRRDPPFPSVEESLPDPMVWPEWSRYVIVRPTGSAAYWDPWRNRMVVGQAWAETGWLGLHVTAHELAHAAQPRWRLRWADSWIKSLLILSLIASIAGSSQKWGPLLAASLVVLGDAGWRWPLEIQADHQARDRLASVFSDVSTHVTVRQWGQRIAQRHRIALGAETLFWGGVTAVLVALVQGLHH